MPLVSSGVEHGNLRELALARMRDLGTQCRDVRTREVGIQEIHHKVKPYEVCTYRYNEIGLQRFPSCNTWSKDTTVSKLQLATSGIPITILT